LTFSTWLLSVFLTLLIALGFLNAGQKGDSVGII
jgi:hypothetical protein